jgi:hypothetical protein
MRKNKTLYFVVALITTVIGLIWAEEYFRFGYIRLKEGTPIFGWQAIICSGLTWIIAIYSWLNLFKKTK